MTRIIVTGSRSWTDEQAVWDALDQATAGHDPANLVIVHGDCRTGADRYAITWAAVRRVSHEAFFANWAQHGKAAGPIRNRAMVNAGADLVLAFPLGTSRGTRDCMAAARNAGIPVKEYAP
jgi:hypothetical protein